MESITSTSGRSPLDEEIAKFRSRGDTYKKTFPRSLTVPFVDFFAGAGGMTSGFLSTRQSSLEYRSIGAFDIDEIALETLALNTGAPVFVRDVRDLADEPSLLASLIPELAHRDANNPLVFIGCPPCQGFSAHRKKDPRNDPRNDLVMAFTTICLAYKPDVIVMENVPEFISGKYQEYFERSRDALESAGYQVHSEIVDLSRYGVPQRRKRAIVVATLQIGFEMPVAPLAVHEARTVREAIGHLSPILAGEALPTDPWHKAPKHTDRILDRIRKIPHDGGDLRDLSEEDQLACHVDLRNNKGQGFTDVYGRLKWDSPAITITAKSSTPSCGRFLHPTQDRNISVREAAILQGFPQNYVFSGPFVRQYRQIGEAIPPLFARFIASAALNHLRGVPQDVVVAGRRVSNSLKGHNGPGASGKRPISVDLFAGAGGLSLGLKASGYSSAYAADLDTSAIKTFNKNVGDGLVRDLRSAEVIAEISDAVGDNPFVIVGGPPCQGFSQQRRGANDDPRNELVIRHAEIALGLKRRPRAVVLENVAYLDSPRGKPALTKYLSMMKSADYTVFRYDTNSANFGVPQMRLRLVLIAVANEFAELFSGLQEISSDRWVTVGESLAGLSSEPDDLKNHIKSRESALNVARMAFVDMGRGRTAIPDDFQLDCHRGYDGHLDVYGRLDWFGYSRTITGGFDSASRGEYVHPFRNRSITAREAARMQGFPDDFEFDGNRADVRRQIGNAVPPLLGYAIGRSLLRVMAA